MKRIFTLSTIIILFSFLQINESFAQNAPTGFTAGTRTTSTLDLSWTDGGGGGSGFIVARHTAAISGNPSGPLPIVGDNLGAATIVYVGAATNFSDDFSTNGPAATGTQYFYKIWSYKNPTPTYSAALTGSMFTISDLPASQVVLAAFSNLSTTQIRANWNASTGAAGNGTSRLVIVKRGSPVDATPVDGTSYAANASFGTGGTGIGPAGNFVVYNGTAQLVTVTGLTNGDYYFKVFSFNGSAGTENYLTGTPGVEANQGTNPSAQPTALAFTAPLNTGLGYTVGWTPVPATTVDGYIVVRRSGTAPTNTPVNGTVYSVGGQVGAATDIVAYVGPANTFNETSLTPATNYFYRIYSYNGSSTGINYLTSSPLGGNRRTFSTEPADQATVITYGTPTNATMNVNWTRGTPAGGNNVIIVGKAGSAPTAPTDGTTYAANAAFGAGTSTDGGSSFVVYKGTAATVPVTSLAANINYFFQAFEFNTTAAGDENYNTATGTNNDGTQSQATANEPINQVTAPATPFANITGTTIRVTWTAAVAGALAPTNYLVNAINKTTPGTYKTVADGTPVGDDTDLTIATGNNDGAQNITFGTNLANWTGLDPGQEYEFRIYSYRTPSVGSAFNPDYNTTSPATVSGFTEPAAQTAITFGAIGNGSLAINLSAVPSAAGVVVLRRAGSAPTAPTIADGTVYIAGATNIAGGNNDVVYVGPLSNFVDDDAGNGLNPSTTYYYIAFTFSGSASKINYLTTGIPAAVNATTLAASATTTVTAAGGGEATTIPSTTTSSPGVSVFNFTVVDNAGSSNKTRITGITINRKDLVSGDINDWSVVLGGARLSGSHGTAISVGVGANITANSIIFSSILTGNEDLGELDNGETLTYTLEVWLKPNLGSATIDGLNFVFQVTPNSLSFTTGSGDAFDTSGAAVESGDTKNVVDVTADRIRITTQPSTAVNASTVLAQQPVFEATDINNNRDLGFNNSVASVNTGAPTNLSPAYTPFNFNSGVATFTDLRFNNVGTSTMTITSNSFVSSPASSPITVSASTNLSGGGLLGINAGPNLINSSINQAVFGFTLTTSGSTLNFTDVTINTTSDPDLAFKPASIKLVRSTDNDFGTAGNNTVVSSTYTTPGNSIDFSPFSISINGTTSYFFIVVDIQDFYPTALPTIQLSITNADFTVSTGGRTGSPQTGINYTLQDNTPPSVLSINRAGASPTNAATVDFTVTFNEPVQASTVEATDFVTAEVGVTGSSITIISPTVGTATVYTVTVNTGTGDGTVGLNRVAAGVVTDVAGNDGTGQSVVGQLYTIDKTPPTVLSVNLAGASPTNATSVNFTVTFNEIVQASTVTSADFTLAALGVVGASITGVTPIAGNATVFTVTVNTGSGSGTIGLNRSMISNVTDVAGNVGTGQFFTGQIYTIDKTPPTIVSITNSISTIFEGSLTQTVTVVYSKPMNNTIVPPITLNSAGSNWGLQTNSGGTNGWTGATYVATFTHNGTQELISGITTSVAAAGAQDLVGNANTGSLASAPFNLDTQKPTVLSINRTNATPNNGSTVNFTVTFSELVQATSVTSADFQIVTAGPTGTFITGVSPIAGNTATFTVTVNTGTGDGTIGLNRIVGSSVLDAIGNNGSGQSVVGQVYTIDKTPPVVTSIVGTSVPLKGIGSTRGIVASSVDFVITFSETNTPLAGIDATDFPILKDATLTIGALSISGSANTRTVTVPIISGTGKISLGVNDDDTLLDAAGNPLGGVGVGNGNFPALYSGTQYYTIALAEPTNPVAALTAPTVTTTSIQVQWNQPAVGSQAATDYLVMAKPTVSGSYPSAVLDGIPVINGAFAQNIAKGAGVQTATFIGLNSGVSYDFIIYPYTLGANNASDNIDFKTTTPATVTASTTVGSAGTLTLTSTPVAVSSIINSSGGAATVLAYNLRDDGSTPTVDNTPVKFTQLVFNNGNPSLDWTTILAGAILSDGANSLTSTAITSTTITFSGINTTTTGLGYVADDATKSYTLRVWLKDPLTVVDNSVLSIVFGNSNFTYDDVSNSQVSSKIATPSVSSGANTIAVIASSLDFVTQPSPFAGLNEPIDATNTSGPPFYGIVNSRDKYGNVDTDFNFSYSISAPTANPSPGPPTFTNGILSLSGMKYNGTGDGKLRIVANGIDSNVGSPPNSIPCNRVDVINVGATENKNGVTTSQNLKGGTAGVVLFGVNITPDYFVSNPINEPSLSSLTFSFSNSYRTVAPAPSIRTTLKSFRVFESTNGVYDINSQDVTTITGTVQELESSTNSGEFNQVKVTFSTPRALYTSGGQTSATRSYFILADIDVSATNTTPKIQPQLIDIGPNDPRITITRGSAKADVRGTEFGFAATKPPALIGASSTPRNGQLNVSAGITKISLYFDVPVLTFDGVAQLYDRKTNKLKATLQALNSNYMPGSPLSSSGPKNQIDFAITTVPPSGLQPDSVYYVTLAQGTFNPTANGGLGAGTGISDDQLNLFGGITYNGTYFFKIASATPPKMIASESSKYEVAPTVASLNASFDQKGKGYYLVLPGGTNPAPDTTQIRTGSYPGRLSFGSFNIEQLAPSLQFFTATGNFSAAGPYDVWIFAKNDANPAVLSSVYGNSTNIFGGGTSGPTFSFTQPLPVVPTVPIYQICPNSFSILSQPIILRETANGTWGSGNQDFNIILPSGFNFDIAYAPKVTLVGGDFSGTAAVNFVNSTILNIRFTNTGSTSLDRIVISDMRVAPSSVNAAGDIRRFGGTGLVNYPEATTVFAKISASVLAAQTVSNSYTTFNDFGSSIGLTSVVTSIPDNFLDKALGRNAIRLIPNIVPTNDYNASFFSGAGVIDDVLNLSGVIKNSAFDITMTRTNLNGCLQTQTEQYTVYDHTKIIPKLTDPIYGPKQALINPNFNSPADVATGTDAPSLPSTATLNISDIAGYSLELMKLLVPKEATNTSQIIFGSDWQSQLDKVLQLQSSVASSAPSGFHRSYKWDFAPILNAKNETSGAVNKNPYENFVATSPQNQIFYTGGSLGFVDFIGKFQSTADGTVLQPLVQRIELFVPAVPIIEVTGSSAIKPGTGTKPPVYVFCEQGSPIIFNGYPAAAPGKSKGYYSLYDSATSAVLYDGKNPTPAMLNKGFTDNANSNGTSTLVPNFGALFVNGYKTIRVEYTYQDDNSPAIGTGGFFIQIAPNPLADFTFSSAGPNAAGPLAICAGNPIDFDASNSTINGIPIGTSSKYLYTWNFDDSKLSSPPQTAGLSKPSHTFTDVRNYNVSLSLISDVGCPSIPKALAPAIQTTVPGPKIIVTKVGDIPNVNFSFLGNCVGDAITFTDESTTDAATSYAARFVWNFDYPNPAPSFTGFNTANTPNALPTIFLNFGTSPNGKVVTNTYSTPKNYRVQLTTTTNVGCFASKEKTIVQLPLKVATLGADFSEFFDTDGGWQALDLSGTIPEPGGNSSWVWNDPTAPGKWITKSYKPNERSALYTACIDLSNVPRPVISFHSNIGLATGEGLVLQYSKDQKNIYDPTKEWDVLGTTKEDASPGLDWYNTKALPSNPGTGYANSKNASGYGWASTLGNTVPKHKLEDITDPSNPLPNNRVILRFALAALNAGGSGIKIDSLRVGSRTRTILFENFTTTDGGTDVTLNNRLKTDADFIRSFTNDNINSTQLVNINYHIGFIGRDQFNLDNPAEPSSRALYYNVSKVPYAFLDGIHSQKNGSDLFKDWGQGAYDLQTLQLANADFTPVGPFVTNVANNATEKTMEIEVYVKPTRDLPASTRLYIGILEDAVLKAQLPSSASVTTGENEFNYILKKLLPDAIGTKYPAQTFKRDVLVRLAPGGKVGGTEKFKWIPDRLYTNNLTVVVFLQDSTREVYQADLFRNLTPPAPITGIEQITSESVNLYPNPANQEFTIELPRALRADASVRMIDQVGQTIDAGVLPTGKNSMTVSTFGLASGVYIVEILSDEGSIVRKKVIVVH